MEILQDKLEAIFEGITVSDLREDMLKNKIKAESTRVV
jgi:hypothetical protein